MSFRDDFILGLAGRIEGLRVARGWSQNELGRQLGYRHHASPGEKIRCWERELRTPTARTLMRIAELFGVTVDYLLYGDGRGLTIISKER